MSVKRIIGASMGNCVHVAGVQHFLDLAERMGWETLFLGPAVPVEKVLEAVAEVRPDVVALGYRLTAANVIPLIEQLMQGAQSLAFRPHWLFGGTRPVAEAVQKLGFFDTVYDGSEDVDDTIAFLRGEARAQGVERPADRLIARIGQKSPYPLLRHHFGLPSLADTERGIAAIAEAHVLDVVSLGIDQNTITTMLYKGINTAKTIRYDDIHFLV